MNLTNEHYQKLLKLPVPWVVTGVDDRLVSNEIHIEISYEGKHGPCPKCGKESKIHDRQKPRIWRHLDTLQYKCYLHCRTPRTKCPEHGTLNLNIPWADKHARFTLMFEAHAVRELLACRSIVDACSLLSLNWHAGQSIMKRAVDRGLKRRKSAEIAWIGMDEKSFRKRQSYVSLINDVELGRVLEVAEGRDNNTAKHLINKGLSQKQRKMVCGVALDMSAPFIKAIRELLPDADIVHDRFHISQHLNESVDKVRRQENKLLQKKKDRRLVGTKFLWLSGMAHMSDENIEDIERLKKTELNTAKAWYVKETFKHFWSRRDEDYARHYFDYWFKEAIQTGLKPVKAVAYTLKRHLENILTYFSSYITNAVSEGLNSKIQSIKANARGFRSFQSYRVSILFFCGKLELFP